MPSHHLKVRIFNRIAVFRFLSVFLLALNGWAVTQWMVDLLMKHRIWDLFSTLRQIPELLFTRTTWVGAAYLLFLTPLLIVLKASADRLKTDIRTVILGVLGLGTMLLLGADLVGGPLSSGNSIVIAVLPSVVLIGFNLRFWKEIKGSVILSHRKCGFIGAWVLFVFILVCCFLFHFTRTGPGGDEITFWYSASEAMRRNGFSGYMVSHPASNYNPGYPIVFTILTAFVPQRMLPEAMNVIPFLYGFAVVAVLLPCRSKFQKTMGVLFSLTLILQLFFLNSRLHSFFFHAFTGKPLVVLCLFSLYLILDRGIPKRTVQKIPALILLVGLGLLTQLIKPPLSNAMHIFLLAVLALRALAPLRLKKHARLEVLFPLLIGSIGGKLLWEAVLHKYHPHAFFEAGWMALAHFDPTIVVTKMLPFIFKNYSLQILTFSISILMGLLWYKRFWIPLLFSSFMIVTIFAIFSTVTAINKDFPSGARYLMQGIYGWLLFFFYLKSNLIGRVLHG